MDPAFLIYAAEYGLDYQFAEAVLSSDPRGHEDTKKVTDLLGMASRPGYEMYISE